MRSVPGGYTIIEVMIFLTISAVIFSGAVLVFNGQQGKSQFEQGMHDLASKVQQYVDQTGTSIFANSGQYTCNTNGTSGRAQLSAGNGGVGTNQACIFLGRALQVVPGQSQIFTYTVLGRAMDAGQPVVSFEDALPEPAISPFDLTDVYDTPWGTVKSGTSLITPIGGSPSNGDLVGFYNSLQDGYNNSGSKGGQSIIAKGYPFTDSSSTPSSPRSAALVACLEEQPGCANAPQISNWSVCFASTGSAQTAQLSVNTTPAGITADVNFINC